MNKEAVDKWVAALRDPGMRQGRDKLGEPTEGMCCLGVACHVAVEEGIISSYNPNHGNLHLYPEVRDWLGLSTKDADYHESSLINDNDFLGGLSFEEIADIIESNPVGLFV